MNKIKVIILAAGFGQRLEQSVGPAVNLPEKKRETFYFKGGPVKPKALLKTGGQEVLFRTIKELKKIKEVDLGRGAAIITNHKYYRHYREWLEQKGIKVNLLIDNRISQAENRRGAVADLYGAIKQAKIHSQPVLALNSDTLFSQFRIRELISVFQARGGRASLISVYRESRDKAHKRGVVDFNLKTKIISIFREKPKQPGPGKKLWASTGICLYNSRAIDVFLPEYIKAAAGQLTRLDSPGRFNEYLVGQKNRGAEVEALEISGRRFDIGDYNGWKEADEFFKN